MNIEDLEKSLQRAQEELYMLRYAKCDPEMYSMAKSDIEHRIMCITDMIEHKKKYNKFINRVKIILAIILVGVAMMVYDFISR
jgi:hypothetical protein